MKLRNKQTGEIVVFGEGIVDLSQIGCKNVAEMIEAGWEDYEEPKEYWSMSCGEATNYTWNDDKYDRATEAVGLKFDTKEECERAIDKLKAWKRLKDKGFKFNKYDVSYTGLRYPCGQVSYKAGNYCIRDIKKDLDLLFGGEE